MKTLGQVIRSYRERQGVSLRTLSQETSIHEDILTTIEAEQYELLPAGPLVLGYVQLIAATLEIPEDTALALYRRDVVPRQHQSNNVPNESRTNRQRWLWLRYATPQTISVLILACLAVMALGVLSWYWWRLDQPPELTVTQPVHGAVVSSPVMLQGQTDAQATVTINTAPVPLDQNGRFSTSLELPPGERALVITSRSSRGLQTERVLFIQVEPPQSR